MVAPFALLMAASDGVSFYTTSITFGNRADRGRDFRHNLLVELCAGRSEGYGGEAILMSAGTHVRGTREK